MDNKMKLLTGILIFALIIICAYFAYGYLSVNYKPKIGISQDINNTLQFKKEKAPDFVMKDVDGKNVRLSDFIGKPVVLNFWASWCPPCKSEMPHFDQVYAGLKENVVFLMVDLVDGQRETKEKGAKYVKDQGFNFPVYFDIEQEGAYAYNISSIPTTIFIDKDGNVVKSYQGAIDENTLLRNIELIK